MGILCRGCSRSLFFFRQVIFLVTLWSGYHYEIRYLFLLFICLPDSVTMASKQLILTSVMDSGAAWEEIYATQQIARHLPATFLAHAIGETARTLRLRMEYRFDCEHASECACYACGKKNNSNIKIKIEQMPDQL